MSTPIRPLQSGDIRAIQTSSVAKDSPLKDEKVIKKCRELLTVEGNEWGSTPLKSTVEDFDKLFMGFIIGQRKSSFQKSEKSKRVRPTPVGKRQSGLLIKDIETPVAQVVETPATTPTGENTESAKVVLMTPSMADSFAKSVQKRDSQSSLDGNSSNVGPDDLITGDAVVKSKPSDSDDVSAADVTGIY